MFTSYDDTCTQRMPFIPPEVYREVIKPGTTRLYDVVKDLGMYPISHCCGFVEPLLEDMIETGAAAWTSAQPCNDIVGIIRKYDDRFIVPGNHNLLANRACLHAASYLVGPWRHRLHAR